jgi:hypothetical protein
MISRYVIICGNLIGAVFDKRISILGLIHVGKARFFEDKIGLMSKAIFGLNEEVFRTLVALDISSKLLINSVEISDAP